ncbi:hypothetical protein HOY80DRAFT_999723 [Tuber brumale]|nr:hypothetical protein HOY80DRAFT_999723 [Tuber brumale]
MSWFCRYCGFGPHSPELFMVCIECGKPADGGEHEPPPSLHNNPNCQDVDSANTPPPRPKPSMWSLDFWYPRRKAGTHSDNTGSILSLTVDQYLAIASLVCFLAFLVYILPSALPQMFLLHK